MHADELEVPPFSPEERYNAGLWGGYPYLPGSYEELADLLEREASVEEFPPEVDLQPPEGGLWDDPFMRHFSFLDW